MALHGSFTDTEPEDVLQILSLGRKTGVLSVIDGARGAELVFRDGMITDAYDGSGRGAEVVFSLLGNRSGAFVFTPREVPEERTIDCDVPSLLLAGARHLDNVSQAQALARQPAARPYIVEGVAVEPDRLIEPDRVVVQLIDGRRTLGEIAAGDGLGMTQTCVSIGRLVEEGLVALAAAADESSPLTGRPAGAAPDRPPEAAEPPPASRRPTASELREIIAYLRTDPGRSA